MKLPNQPFYLPLGNCQDARGLLGVLEYKHLPFQVQRIFWIRNVPANTTRGGHAHRTSEQVLICIKGIVEVELEDIAGKKQQFRLSHDNHRGLYLPPLYWGYYKFKNQAVALCLASDCFDESDYIRDYHEFKKMQDAGPSGTL